MTVETKKTGTDLEIIIDGRLDTTTSPELEYKLKESLDGVENLVINLKSLEYVSSAGLRVLLQAQKTMNKQGKMIIRNVSEEVMEIFEVTGFNDILTIE